MTDHHNNVIERVEGHVSRALYDAYANHDYANGSVWAALAQAALEASHHAELVEALRYFAFDMPVFGATADQTTANATVIRARVEDARTLLAQIGGER